ncbi:hypothetical protein DES53_1011046 [Roseimicrobium gellanilyticum]|uniref:Uncharacterized protein n=1 Tax=Roseimicrobium gellanilyticum TaxID=748857 RepID=A0A366HXN0_9BACT|nr:hypothetical protein DES53_1011046 [Roseimicrobium gellanilyticum]
MILALRVMTKCCRVRRPNAHCQARRPNLLQFLCCLAAFAALRPVHSSPTTIPARLCLLRNETHHLTQAAIPHPLRPLLLCPFAVNRKRPRSLIGTERSCWSGQRPNAHCQAGRLTSFGFIAALRPNPTSPTTIPARLCLLRNETHHLTQAAIPHILCVLCFSAPLRLTGSVPVAKETHMT